MSFMGHALAWALVYTCWLLATRAYHPTLLIALLATGLLVAASASAVYLHRNVLRRRFLAHGSRVRYLAELTGLVAVLDVVVVLAIQLVYDLFWGPDPNRFGFLYNAATDGAIIVLHMMGAALIAAVGRRVRQRRAA